MKIQNKNDNYNKKLTKEIDEGQAKRMEKDKEKINCLLLEREMLKIELQMIQEGRL